MINRAAATGGDARQLVGYLVSQSGLPLDTSALQAQLRETLPPHMVPVVLLQLPQLPLSANGKLDRKALPLPELKTQASGRAPKAGSETIIAAAFASLLGCDVQDADADFFALGGHSLLAMKLAAQLSRQFARQVTPGQVMVASTVAKLATIIDGEEDSSRRMGFETILPLREGNGPTLFCFHPASGFARQFSVLSRYLDPQWSIIGIQSPRPHGPMQTATNWMKSAKRIWQRYLSNNRTALITCWGIPLAVRWRRVLRRDCVPVANRWHFLACWIRPPETQNWQEKKLMVWTRKCWRRLTANARPSPAAQQGSTSTELFTTIEGNYADAVRLLTTAHSVPFDGKATLFVAERTLQEGMSPERARSPWIAELDIYRQDCAHVDIISVGV